MVLSAEEKRERHNARAKIYREKNKQKIKESRDNSKEYYKAYREKNKEKLSEYYKTPIVVKTRTLYKWKLRGLICPDVDSLYCRYINAKNCELCNIPFGVKGDGTRSFRCMDHNHSNGQFRNILCCTCNLNLN